MKKRLSGPSDILRGLFDEFESLLISFQIQHVIDIRRFPGSKRFPQYNKELLATELAIPGIHYTHMEALGGRRNPRSDSPNTAWRVKAFRGYADYMETDEFKVAFIDLEKLAMREHCVIMCSEAVWWSCYRSSVHKGRYHYKRDPEIYNPE